MYGYQIVPRYNGITPAREQASVGYYPVYQQMPQVPQQQMQQQSSGISLPVTPVLKMLGIGGSSTPAAGASTASGATAGASSGLSSGISAALSNPWTGVVAAALAGATALSADSAAAGKGSNAEKWGGPAVNIPMKIAQGDWEGVMDDGAMGPVGAIYNIAQGEDVGKSLANSLGPLGQVPYLLFQGKLPFSGGSSSQDWIKALIGFGL